MNLNLHYIVRVKFTSLPATQISYYKSKLHQFKSHAFEKRKVKYSTKTLHVHQSISVELTERHEKQPLTTNYSHIPPPNK
jgi:hypothetical protein